MAFNMKPFDNSFFDANPSDLFRDFGRQFSINFQEVIALKQMSKNLKMLT